MADSAVFTKGDWTVVIHPADGTLAASFVDARTFEHHRVVIRLEHARMIRDILDAEIAKHPRLFDYSISIPLT